MLDKPDSLSQSNPEETTNNNGDRTPKQRGMENDLLATRMDENRCTAEMQLGQEIQDPGAPMSESPGDAELAINDSQNRITFQSSPQPQPMIELIRLASDSQIYVSLLKIDHTGCLEWTHGAEIRQHGQWHCVPQMPPALYTSLRLPSEAKPFGSTRELLESVWRLLRQHTTLSAQDSKILAYWSLATWFPDVLRFLPSVVVTGSAPEAEAVLRTLAAVCRKPVLLAGISPGILSAGWISELMPTLLIHAPQLSNQVGALIESSNRPGYLMGARRALQPIYCAKCVYLDRHREQHPLYSNSIRVHVPASSGLPSHDSPTEDVVTDFQARLLLYRFSTRDQVCTSRARVNGFRSELCAIAESLAAAVVADPNLHVDIIELLRERDQQLRVDCASAEEAIVIKAILSLCHQPDAQQAYVRDIAKAAINIYSEEGEKLKIGSVKAGHILKYLGLFTRRLGNAGRGLKLDKATQFQVHKLAQSYEVLPLEPVCGHCQQLQAVYTQEFVNSV